MGTTFLADCSSTYMSITITYRHSLHLSFSLLSTSTLHSAHCHSLPSTTALLPFLFHCLSTFYPCPLQHFSLFTAISFHPIYHLSPTLSLFHYISNLSPLSIQHPSLFTVIPFQPTTNHLYPPLLSYLHFSALFSSTLHSTHWFHSCHLTHLPTPIISPLLGPILYTPLCSLSSISSSLLIYPPTLPLNSYCRPLTYLSLL